MGKKVTIAALLIILAILLGLCAHRASGQTSAGPIMIRLLEYDGQLWSFQLLRDTMWQHYSIPLSSFGNGSEFLNTPVTKFMVVPVGGGGILGGPLTEVADWIDDVVIADSLIDNFDDGDFSDWFRDAALNGSYLEVSSDTETPDSSPYCMKLVHGNTMGQSFAGWIERRFTGWSLTPEDTLYLWLRGVSYPLTEVDNGSGRVPAISFLYQNYPNPFNPSTTINYDVHASGFVRIGIFDVLGREVRSLVNEIKHPGKYSVKFDGTMFSGGMYFCRMECGDFRCVKRIVLEK